MTRRRGDVGYGPVLNAWTRKPLRRTVSRVQITRTLASGRAVLTDRYMLTLECGCVVERMIPLPIFATCESPEEHGR